MNKVLECLRSQAWERAKGELNSMLVTFHRSLESPALSRFDELELLVSKFIRTVEDEGLNC